MKRKIPAGQESIKLKKEFRHLSSRDMKVDAEARTIEFPFSSEYPVERWFGDEILSHDPGAADFSRLNDGAPLLFNHDMDSVIGVIERAYIGDDKRGYAVARFSKNSDLANQVFADMQDGIIRNVSFGYQIRAMMQTPMVDPNDPTDSDGDDDSYTATDWEAYEISMVSVPADPTVGIGRNENLDLAREVPVRRIQPANAAATEQRSLTMPDKTAAEIAEENKKAISTATADATTQERARVAEIMAMGASHNLSKFASKLISDGASVSEARGAVLAELQRNPSGESMQSVRLDLTEKEAERYSLVKALRAYTSAATRTGDGWKDAGFELECSQAIAKRTGKDTNGFYMPVNIGMSAEMRGIAEKMGKDYTRNSSGTAYAVGTAGSGTTGGTLVATNLMPTEFIEVLRNKARVMQAGARMLSGLVGNVDLPRQTAASTAYWVAEGIDETESEAAFDKLSFTPKTIGAYSQITRNMLMQSTPDIEVLVRDDLAQVLALGIDLAALSGSGTSGQPKGIVNLSTVNTVVGGTNGAALTIDHLIALETAVMDSNIGEDGCSYMVNPQTVGWLKTLKSTTGQYLWTNNPNSVGGRTGTPGEINGYSVNRTKQLTNAGSKGTNTNLSTLIFGEWTQLFIAEWGVLEILPNPYGAGFKSGTLEMRALQTVDVQTRYEKAFGVMTDAQATLGHTYS